MPIGKVRGQFDLSRVRIRRLLRTRTGGIDDESVRWIDGTHLESDHREQQERRQGN